jgi:competence protein ComEC
MKRPLVVSAIALVWGIVLSDVSISHIWGILFIIMSLSAMLLLFKALKDKVSLFVLLAIPFMIIGYSAHSLNKNHHFKLFETWQDKNVTVTGSVFNVPEFKDGKTRFILKANDVLAETGEGQAYSGPGDARIMVTIYSENPIAGLKYGSRLKLAGKINIPEGRRNLGGFDTRRFLASKEVSGTMYVPEKALTILEGTEEFWLKKTGYEIRSWMIGQLNRFLPERQASVLSGMLIGYTSYMPEEMENSFRRTGLSHVMAVSGANILFILAPVLWLLKRVGFSPRWSSVLAFPVMLFYVFATGMEASVVRAAIMAGITLIGMFFWRRTDIYCSLATAAIIILVKNSFMFYDPGFILSFLATLSLAMFYKPIFERMPKRIPKSTRDIFSGTMAAQLGVIPYIIYNFNTLSIVSVPANLLVVPITGFLTILGVILVVTGSLLQFAGQWLGIVTKIIIDVMLFFTEKLSEIPWAEINVATPGILLIFLFYFIILYLRYGHPKLSKEIADPMLAGILILCGAIIIYTSVPDRTLRIYFADVGQGDCILIRTPENKNIMIDGGGSVNDIEGSYAGERIVVPLLYDLNMINIDIMIATHGHVDHTGGLKSVLDAVKVKKLIVADAKDAEMQELIQYASSKGTIVERVKEGRLLFSEGMLALEALYPLEETYKMPDSSVTNANELSLVARLDYGRFSALFTGDIGAETEKRIIDDGACIECDLLKVAHHGSKYSSADLFLEQANPAIAVISAGRNRYGHPHDDTLERLKGHGAIVYSTLERGGVLVETDKNAKGMRVTTVIGDP